MRKLLLFLLLCLLSSSCFSRDLSEILNEINSELILLTQDLKVSESELKKSNNLLTEMTNCRNKSLIVINEQKIELRVLEVESAELKNSLKRQDNKNLFNSIVIFGVGLVTGTALTFIIISLTT